MSRNFFVTTQVTAVFISLKVTLTFINFQSLRKNNTMLYFINLTENQILEIDTVYFKYLLKLMKQQAETKQKPRIKNMEQAVS